MVGAFGAIIGLVTSLLPEGIDIFRKGQDHKYELELMRVNAEIAEGVAAQRKLEAEAQADIAQMEGLYQQYSNQKTDNWVDKVNALIRPGITICFVVAFMLCVLAMVFQSVIMGASVAGSIAAVFPILGEYVSAVMAFYFGNRQLARNRGKA